MEVCSLARLFIYFYVTPRNPVGINQLSVSSWEIPFTSVESHPSFSEKGFTFNTPLLESLLLESLTLGSYQHVCLLSVMTRA